MESTSSMKMIAGAVLLRKAEHVAHHPRTFAEIFLHELRAHDANERGGGMMRHRLGEHGLSGARGSVEQDAAGGSMPNLAIEVKVRQGQLHSLTNLLLLHVHPAHVAILHVRSLGIGEERDARVRLRGEDVHERVGVTVQRHRRAGLEQLAVQGAQDAKRSSSTRWWRRRYPRSRPPSPRTDRSRGAPPGCASPPPCSRWAARS